MAETKKTTKAAVVKTVDDLKKEVKIGRAHV